MHVSGYPMMRWHVRKFVWILMALLLPGPVARAYPSLPESLWAMTEASELVVWADVEEVSPLPKDPEILAGLKPPPPDMVDMVARLRIREVWKGEARQGEQLLVHWGESDCPPAPYFEKGHAVVAFLTYSLRKVDDAALSYGTRYPRGPEEVVAYRQAVALAKDAQHIQSQARSVGNRLNLEPMRADWLVRVAAHPATRWEVLYDLLPKTDDAHASSGGRDRAPVRLTRAQREVLVRGFVESPPLDRGLPMMLTALRGHADQKVDQAAARALETVLSQGKPRDWASRAFNLLRERHGEALPPAKESTQEDLVARALRDAASGPSGPGADDEDSLMREWARFKKRHQLKPALLPLPVEPPVAGTGGDTTL
ncbi:hypothetical protein [Myxococcus landrumensis]|uniref:HEAT repeat domain-containing protein n=1 Tax=Myxococcus landrumensis TaxID=2813577 RepID=A0ABX7NAW3_9BACT|nr:hypothetical protein [Myxococcus landrumus]QSQ13463.1 hypothetical protein JY572_34825 [Myxococcus landrumus]